MPDNLTAAELREQFVDAMRVINDLRADLERVTGERDEAVAECEKLRKDAERWRSLREPVRLFATVMEGKLRQHDAHRQWDDSDVDWLRDRVNVELSELDEALELILTKHGPVDCAREAADVANYLMMIADVTGGLVDAAMSAGGA